MARDLSLRGRLTRIVIVLFIGGWLVAALATIQSARAAFLQETDKALASILMLADTVGNSVASQLRTLASQQMYTGEEIGRDSPSSRAGKDARKLIRLRDVPGTDAEQSPRLNVWTAGEHYLVGSGTPAFASPAPTTLTEMAAEQLIGDEQYRVMYRHDAKSNIWYAAGIASRQIRFGGSELLFRLLLPLALVLPLTAVALYLGIARGLQPLGRLVEAIESRRRSTSLEPLPDDLSPQEMRPVLASLNHLLARLAAKLEDEKSFTANAAHELKTPLAAISAEVHLCRRLTNEIETRERMERVLQRVDRASHSVNQLLLLARLDHEASLPATTFDLAGLLQDIIAESGDLASERQLHIHVDIPAIDVCADADTVAIMLRNLVVNAFRYTPQGGAVSILMTGSTLTFSNDSRRLSGIARLTDRFYRMAARDGDTGTSGSGLGLAIVLRVCELHGFTLRLDYREDEQRFFAAVDFQHGVVQSKR